MNESAEGTASAKALLRAQIRARRQAMEPSARIAAGQAMAEHAWATLQSVALPSGPIACTWSLPTEPPTDPLIARLLAAGKQVVTPRILDAVALVWIQTTAETELVTGPLGIRTPVGSQEVDVAQCAAIVIPALALDPSGVRLGQGGGYFDRALAGLRPVVTGGPLRIGMVFAAEVLTHLPSQPHDEGVDLILTEDGVRAVDATYGD